MKKLSMLGICVGAALLSAAPFSLQFSQKSVVVSVDSADARVGRPLTPGSVAGVNRRVHRRAYRRLLLLAAVPPPSITSSARASSDGGTGEGKRLCRLEVDDQIEFGRLLYWELSQHFAIEYAAGIHACRAARAS